MGRPLLALGLGLLLTAGRLSGQEPMSDADCLMCHEAPELIATDSEGRERSLYVDAERLRGSVHGELACVDCHSDLAAEHPDDGLAVQPVNCAGCHEDQSASYGASVHGIAKAYGLPGAATCADCHGAHNVLPLRSADSPMQPGHLADTCGQCHDDVAAEVRGSVHGRALEAGRRDAPICTDCHSEHRIEGLKDQSPHKVAERTCSQCHASERLNAKYHLPVDRVETFLGSYHGLAGRLGSTRAANCASCHGVHRILPSSDPASTIHPDHLVETCGKCHPGATANFALGRVHTSEESDSTDLGTTLNRWVRRIYLGLIAVTIGTFLLHNGSLWLRQALAARRAMEGQPERMSRSHRWQHSILALSFALLALSGFALKFPDSWLAGLLGSDELIRRWTHRGAAVVMLLLGVYHLLHLAMAREGRQLLRDLWPHAGDLREALGNLRYALGRRAHRVHPEGRFGYAEKIEYWAVVWGTVIMGVTGFIVWFPVAVTQVLPRWTVEVATTIHYYEAILACLAILVWHFYHIIFDPEVYPLNWAFWDGRAPARKTPPAAPDSLDA